MTRDELARDIRSVMGKSFLTRKEFAEYMGYKDPHSVDKILKSCERTGNKYHVVDLANNLFRADIRFG